MRFGEKNIDCAYNCILIIIYNKWNHGAKSTAEIFGATRRNASIDGIIRVGITILKVCCKILKTKEITIEINKLK